MKLKALMLRKKIDDKKKLIEDLREKSEGFATREAELEQMISEAETDEEKAAVEEEVEKFETEKSENEAETKKLEGEVAELENDLKEVEAKQDNEPKLNDANNDKPQERRKEGVAKMSARTRFHGMTIEERAAFFGREDVKEFVERAREVLKQKRNVSGAELNIPEVVFELIHADIEVYSKLYKYINVKTVKGKARQNILGATPEGIWTEMAGKINEVTLGFTMIEVDGYKVAAFIPIDNYLLEDSDIALGQEIINALGKGLGLAIDKAILYGKLDGKMPNGILPTLAAVESTPNIITIPASKTDLALFKAIVEASAKLKHAEGDKFWTMNSTTHTKLLAASLGANSNAAIVAGMNNTMPVIGGNIEELDFIPDDVIIGGYGARYIYSERAGITVTSSTEYQFLDDNTIFKATARGDGKPAFDDAFIAVGINGATPSATAVTFPTDAANAGE